MSSYTKEELTWLKIGATLIAVMARFAVSAGITVAAAVLCRIVFAGKGIAKLRGRIE